MLLCWLYGGELDETGRVTCSGRERHLQYGDYRRAALVALWQDDAAASCLTTVDGFRRVYCHPR